MHGALLVAHEDVLDAILLEQLVVDRQDGTARIAENMLDALIGESLKHHLGARHCARHRILTDKNRPRASFVRGRSELEEWRKSLNRPRTLRLGP